MKAKATSLVGLDVHARQTHARCSINARVELGVSRLLMPPLEVPAFWERLAPCWRCTTPDRRGSGWPARRERAGSTCRSPRPDRSRRGRATGSRPTGVTRSGLVRLLAAGELSFASVPTVQDEAFRDLIRSSRTCAGI
jgi:hypothetical protein